MKDRILAQFEALIGLVGEDSSLRALDHQLVVSSLYQSKRAYEAAYSQLEGLGRVDAGVDETARQASLQGGPDAGRRLTLVTG